MTVARRGRKMRRLFGSSPSESFRETFLNDPGIKRKGPPNVDGPDALVVEFEGEELFLSTGDVPAPNSVGSVGIGLDKVFFVLFHPSDQVTVR